MRHTARLFLALMMPWAGYLVLEVAFRGAAIWPHAPGLLLVMALYGLGALFLVASFRRLPYARSCRRLLAIAAGLVVADQVAKLAIMRWLPLGANRSLIPGALALAHAHNIRGSWLAVQLDWSVPLRWPLVALGLTTAIAAIAVYRYYAAVHRRSFWAALSLVGLVAGTTGAVVDLISRGLVVDYLEVAGLVVADLKDFSLWMGIAALLAEIADSQTRWWRHGPRSTWRELRRLVRFTVDDLRTRGRARQAS